MIGFYADDPSSFDSCPLSVSFDKACSSSWDIEFDFVSLVEGESLSGFDLYAALTDVEYSHAEEAHDFRCPQTGGPFHFVPWVFSSFCLRFMHLFLPLFLRVRQGGGL